MSYSAGERLSAYSTSPADWALRKVKESRVFCYLPNDVAGLIHFFGALSLCEMQASFRFWTSVTVPTSIENNHYTKSISKGCHPNNQLYREKRLLCFYMGGKTYSVRIECSDEPSTTNEPNVKRWNRQQRLNQWIPHGVCRKRLHAMICDS